MHASPRLDINITRPVTLRESYRVQVKFIDQGPPRVYDKSLYPFAYTRPSTQTRRGGEMASERVATAQEGTAGNL